MADVSEQARLENLRALDLLDSPREAVLDRITAFAADLFDVPIALVTVVGEDRIWLRSRHGVDATHVEREPGLCDSAIQQRDVWVVERADEDERSRDNGLVTGPLGLRFYAGAPLWTSGGAVGTLSLIDQQHRTFGEVDRRRLAELGEVVVELLELRRSALNLLRVAEVDVRHTTAELQQSLRSQRLAAEGQRLLASLTGRLLHEPTLGIALDAVAKESLPYFGVGTAISRLDAEGFRTTHVAHVDPRAVPIMGQAVDESEAVNLDETPAVVEHVMVTGEPLTCTVTEALEWPGMPEAPGLKEALAELGVAHFLILPLAVRGRAVGALTFLEVDPEKQFEPERIEVAVELAGRIAAAMENDRLHSSQTEIAEALQSSLLPPVLPEIPGVEIAAHYRAAGPADIGGDFYDVFSNDGWAWNILLGDVSGKGAEAAAIAGLARYTARALAIADASAPAILERLNTAVERQSRSGKFLTALCATVRHVGDGVEVDLADAGHPPALIRRADGKVEEVELRGTVLGMFPEARVDHRLLHLGPGDLLLLYTDGATEARNRAGEFLGLDGLKALLRDVPGRLPANVLRQLVQGVIRHDGGAPKDDLALIALRVRHDAP